jgi:preprotein translocase subunit SecG
MNFVVSIILTIQILCALGMIGLILVQHGKGADMGASFGSGSAGSLFGAAGSANFLSRTTAVLATIFFLATLALAYFGSYQPKATGGVMERASASQPAASQPAAGQIPAGAASAAAQSAPAAAASQAGGKASDIPK